MQYSRLDFSSSTDRPFAIAGLETRMINAFETAGGFGVFERYLGRSLLWGRASDVDRMSRIFPRGHGTHVPSWSWMAHEGGISFLDLPFGDIEWSVNTEFRSPYSTGRFPGTSRGRLSSTRNGQPTVLRVAARSFDMNEVAQPDSALDIIWDDPTTTHDQLRCVIIGRLASEKGMATQKHWVLVVQELGLGLYERVGAGFVTKDRITLADRNLDSSLI